MSPQVVDLVIVGAGPVGLMCAYLAKLCGMSTVIVDKSEGPLQVGRADALNARTLQLLEVGKLFDQLYPLGKPCNTSSVWADGKFLSRQSSWWDELEGCFHKHFLMLGQSFVEKLLDEKLTLSGAAVRRSTVIKDVEVLQDNCLTTLSSGEKIQSRYVIGADGSRSFVREKFKVPFEIVRPQIVWAVLDGVVETDFPKVPEIIVFQADTSDVAWIPREGDIDRFYVRMDTTEFTLEEAVAKINRAIKPHVLGFKKMEWFSQFSVKESVAEKFFIQDRVFLVGDASHIHSVNGGQGLNTGLADAFNLIWKLNMTLNHGASLDLLQSYESERKPVALSVIEASGELVRSTKYSANGTHAEDYVRIVQKRAGNITGMGIRYAGEGLIGSRLYDSEVRFGSETVRLYSLLNYSKYTLFVFGDVELDFELPEYVQLVVVGSSDSVYVGQAVLVRPDAYIESTVSLGRARELLSSFI
ncbi:FAD-binding protein [Bdellovibrio bacteriovorus]|uniref:FAD monooxygenase, PheA/TfdB family n=1 Tax=Bdellovibrio bacteriovorus (strain ATCC 15356 / DSM 50701 / NCIMB 9529 / HD100) TaxID=264462 RepID=Q6MN10_BDEBA|nr:FAD-binding protein [Bdellovibrio bacteriovorus]CAE79342.1 FAD monooxygenase, PheA/TfdB family [Bdellovibrio bacteriovorus HD100]